LIFIRFLYNGKLVEEAAELMEVSLSTGHRWLDEWNEGGYEGLYPKYKNGGVKSKLTDEQFQKLDELMYTGDFLTTRKVHGLIQDNFDVDYSMKRVREIVHKLGYSYKKGYIIYSKMPADAPIRLKKKLKNYNLEDHYIFLLDQVAPQNLSNSPRTICKKSEKNILIQNPDKFSITGIGLQAINGNSLIRFPPNSRIKEMIKFLTESRMINCKNSSIINRISDILNYENITIKKIIELLKNNLSDDKTLVELIINTVFPEKTRKKIIKDLENYVEKPKMTKKETEKNKKKIEGILRKIYIKLLKPLESYLKEEKTMVVVLDNYTTHHALLLKQACKYLNITLVHLPPYSPKLNPIEQVWRTIKGELSSEFIIDEEFLIKNFEKIFYENVDKKSFTKNWIKEYIHDKINDLLVINMCEKAILPI
jgi:transposase